jgi:hypothetical protein
MIAAYRIRLENIGEWCGNIVWEYGAGYDLGGMI